MFGSYDHHKLYKALELNDDATKQSLTCVKSNKIRVITMSIQSMIEMDRRAMSSLGIDTFWSIPKSRRDFFTAIDHRMLTEKMYESNKRNYGRYIDELEKAYMIHSFGFRDMTAYCFEPFILSWRAYNKSTVCLFPGSLIRLIDSMESLFSIFSSVSNGRSISRKMMYERFVKMIEEKRGNLHPSIQKAVPKLSDENVESYPAIVRDCLLNMDMLAGMEYVEFDMESLPSSVYAYGFSAEDEEFAELIPREKRASIQAPVSAYTNTHSWNESAAKSSLIPTVDLNLTGDPIHLLQLIEREYHRVLKIPYNRRLFTNYQAEIDAATKLWDSLDIHCSKTNETIVKWVSWFVNDNKEFSTSRSILLELLSTWSIFSSIRPETPDVYAQEENVVNHLSNIFSSCSFERAVQEALLIYGFAISYAYMQVTYGRDMSKDNMAIAMSNMELSSKISVEKVRSKLLMMAKATARNGYKMGPIMDDVEMCTKIRNLMDAVGAKVDDSDRDHDSTPALENYWTFVESHC